MMYNLKKTALALGLMMALPVMAENTVTPQVVHAFANSWGIYTPPVWEPKREALVGVSAIGGETYSVDAYGFPMSAVSGRVYSLGLEGMNFLSLSLDNKTASGLTATNLLVTPAGDVVGGMVGGSYLDENEQRVQAGVLFRISENLTVSDYRPADAFSRNAFPVGGQLALGANGQVYANHSGGGSFAGENTPNTFFNGLVQLQADDQFQRVVDYALYNKQYADAQGNSTNNWWLSKGDSPSASIWSAQDNALYLVSRVNYPGTKPNCVPALPGFTAPDCSDGTRLTGHLIRISGEALNSEAGVQEGDIEILFHFTEGTGGQIASNATHVPSVIEDGDFLYGISPGVKDADGNTGNGIWRIRKSGLADNETAADTFTTVHRFAPVADQDRVDNPLADDSANIVGANLYGSLVLAADGNIYGTTQSDDRTVRRAGSASRPTYTPSGAGTLFRIVSGDKADRSDDTLELVYHFDAATIGGTPKGLSAGPIHNGKQIIIGATATGAASGNGGIFTFEVTPLPGSLNLQASATSGLPGDQITLTWASEWAQNCTASASANDVTDWTGELTTSGEKTIVAVAGTTAYSLACEAFNGEQLTASVSVSATAPVVTPEPSTPNPATPKKSSGGGNTSLGLLLLMSALLWTRKRG